MIVFHEEEGTTIVPTEIYTDTHPGVELLIEFASGEAYIGTFFTAYDTDNSGELDIEDDDPRYDEFFQIVFAIERIVKDGPHRYDKYLTLDYRDYPAKITDITNNVVVYPA